MGVGVVLAASVLLTGCAGGGSDKPADAKPSTEASQEAEAPTSDCPELTEDATVDGSALGACITEVVSDTAGYVAKTGVLGVESTSRFNPSEKALESVSRVGSLVVIGDDVWVKSSSSDWRTADPASSDPTVAALSTVAQNISTIDPAAAAAAITGDLTVTGTSERLGQKVHLVSGTVEQQRTPVDVVLEVTPDYINLASTSTASVGGQTVEVTKEITEWDVKQAIVAPI